MPRFAANLTMLFNEVGFLDRFDAAAKAGFKGVEFLFPYAFEPGQIADKLKSCQLELVLHNLPAGKWEAGERGIACHPERVAEFREGVVEAHNIAFSCLWQLGDVDGCIDLLIRTNRAPEAVLLAQTYKPSRAAQLAKNWKDGLETDGRSKVARILGMPPNAEGEGDEEALVKP